jgi:hypothetical protein
MEFALFLFFLIFTTALTSVISYYINLLFFNKKEIYEREEITQVFEPVFRILLDVCKSGGNLFLGIGLFIGFALFAWTWALFGGAIGTAHYTNSLGNYFFNAPLLFLGFLFGFPFLKEGFSAPGPSKQFFDSGRAILSGLGLGAWSASLATWGLYHEFYFLFVFLSGILVLYPLCYFWNGKAFFGITIGPKEKLVQVWDDDIYADPDPEPAPKSMKPPKQKSSERDPFPRKEADPFAASSLTSDWDEIEEGGLGDEPPSLDDFEDPK